MYQFFVDFFWAIQAFIIVFFTLLIGFIEKKIHKKILPKLKKTGLVWDDALAKALHYPLQCLIWLLGISLAVQLSVAYTENDYLADMVDPVRNVGVGILLIWFLVRFIHHIEINMLESSKTKTKFDETSIRAIGQILRASVFITGLLIVLQIIGIPIAGVLAFGGFGGIAVGFAAQDFIANFFGGLALFMERPFKIGDEIRCIEKPIEGVIEHIGWRSTRVRTYDRRPLFVPNSIFAKNAIENLTRMTNRRIKQNFTIRYKDSTKIPQIIEDIEKKLAENKEIDQSRLTTVDLINFSTHSFELQIYAFTKVTGFRAYRKIQQAILLEVINIVRTHGAEVAIPEMIVDLLKD